jgi:hypothetical protein
VPFKGRRWMNIEANLGEAIEGCLSVDVETLLD